MSNSSNAVFYPCIYNDMISIAKKVSKEGSKTGNDLVDIKNAELDFFHAWSQVEAILGMWALPRTGEIGKVMTSKQAIVKDVLEGWQVRPFGDIVVNTVSSLESRLISGSKREPIITDTDCRKAEFIITNKENVNMIVIIHVAGTSGEHILRAAACYHGTDAKSKIAATDFFGRIAKADHLLKRLEEGNKVMRIHNTGVELPIDPAIGWENVCLTEVQKKMTQDDFEFFLKNEDWYRNNKVEYKRGYLLHGPPGNGKTLTIHAMANTQGVSVMGFDFSDCESANNKSLQSAMQQARENAPCLFIMEDLDRAISPTEGVSNSSVTLNEVLNMLDGVSSRDGVVVVATANSPQHLDAAILRRPGRYDRVVEFDNPNEVQREQFLSRLFDAKDFDISEDCIKEVVSAMENKSMATLKEIFIASAATAIDPESKTRAKVTDKHVIEAVGVILEQFEKTSGTGASVGFSGVNSRKKNKIKNAS
ncbi:MAG: AAA family ATPase [Nanoarchaeota archaeon]